MIMHPHILHAPHPPFTPPPSLLYSFQSRYYHIVSLAGAPANQNRSLSSAKAAIWMHLIEFSMIDTRSYRQDPAPQKQR